MHTLDWQITFDGGEETFYSFEAKAKRWLMRNVLNCPRLFAHLRKRGIQVLPWVVNSEEVCTSPTAIDYFCLCPSLC